MKTHLLKFLFLSIIILTAKISLAQQVVFTSLQGNAATYLIKGNTNLVPYGFSVFVPAGGTFAPGPLYIANTNNLNGFISATLNRVASADPSLAPTSGTTYGVNINNPLQVNSFPTLTGASGTGSTYYFYLVISITNTANPQPANTVFSLLTQAAGLSQNGYSGGITVNNTNSKTYIFGNAAPAITYPSPQNYFVGTTISNVSPTNTGGTANSYSINTPLPLGLSFSTTTGVISGTPTLVSASTNYTVTATNSYGTSSSTFSLSVSVPPPNISYASPQTYVVGTAITTLNPTNSGGAVVSYSTTGLPAGLNLNALTGAITGTPTSTTVSGVYSVTATNLGGSSTANITITINGPPIVTTNTPVTSIYGGTGTVGGAITTTGGYTVTEYGIVYSTSATTPTTANSKFIMGASATTPTTYSNPLEGLTPNTLYYVRAYAINSIGTGYGAVTSFITLAEPNISYVTPQTYTVNTNIGSLSPTNTGGSVPVRTFGAYTTFATGLSNYFMAFDGNGNLYEADATSVIKYTPAGVKSTLVSGYGINTPTGIAVDPSGNVYLSSTSNIIYKITPAGVSSTFISSGLSTPYGLVFDNAGNLYIANSGANNILKVAYGTNTTSIYATGFNQPYGLAIDDSGKLYETDRTGNKIYSIVGGVKTQIGGTFTGPTGIAVAADGSIYFASLNTTDNIYVIPAGSTTATAILTGSPLNNPRNIVLDNTGEYLYISNTDAGTILKQSVTGYTYTGTLPAGLSFDYTTGTITGTPTAVTVPAGVTITVTAYNSAGNSVTPLTIIVNPTAPTATGPTLCGAQSTTITASGSLPAGGTYNWYTAATGGTAVASTAAYSPFIGGTTTLYVSYTSGTNTSARTPVLVTVNQKVSSSINSPMISYPFESGSLTDWSVLGNNAVISTAATTIAPTLTADRNGMSNSAYLFAGTNSTPSFMYSTVNYSQMPLIFSYSVWFKTTGSTAGGRLLGFSGQQNGNGASLANATHDRDLYMADDGRLGFSIYTGSTQSIITTTKYNDGLWHHVIVTIGKTNGMRLYVDGVWANSATPFATYAAPQASAGYWRIGGDATSGTGSPTNNYFNGAIDDVAIYNYEMSATDAASNDMNLYKFSSGYCANNSLTITAQTITGATYNWVDNATTSITATGSSVTFANATSTNYGLVTSVNSCSNTSATVTPNALTYTWTGAASTDFVGPLVTTNWTNTSTNSLNQNPLFNGTESIVIPTGLTNYPVLGASGKNIYSLTMAANTTLTLNGFVLGVGCNIINNAGGKILYGPGAVGSTAANASAITWNGSGTVANQSYTGAATINTAQVGTMTVNNTVTNGLVTINSGAIDVYSALNMTAGKLAITSPAVLTLKSIATQSAYTNALTSATSITGNVNVERFITGGSTAYRSYRLLSSPVNVSSSITGSGNLGLTYINTTPTVPTGSTALGALTAGPGGTGSNFSVTNLNPTIYLYNESFISNNRTFTGGKAPGVTAIGNASSTPAYSVNILSAGVASNVNIPVGNGYFFYFIGDNHLTTTTSTRVPENTTITATGYLNQGDVPVRLWSSTSSTSLSYTSTYGVNAGYNMVGNPYSSTIDLSKVYTDNYNLTTNAISPNFYELNNQNPSQNYVTVNFTVPGTPLYSGTNSSRASRYVASGQGFFTKTTATNQTLTFKEDQKVTTQLNGGTNLILLESAPKTEILANGISTKGISTVNNFNALQPAPQQLNGLHVQLYQDSILNDECGIYFGKDWTDQFDNNDAFDLDGVGPKIFMSSFTSDGQRTAINFLSDYRQGKRIKLYVKSATDGMRNLVLTNIENIDTVNYKINLVDHFKNDSLDIGRYKTYAFNVVNADTTTFGADRFELVISQLPTSKYQLATFTAQKASDGVLVTWRAYNEDKNYAFTLEKQDANGTSFTSVYNIQSNGGTIYKYTDKTPNKGNNVYRLKQVDLFGNITYAGPVSIYYDQDGTEGMFTLYPNPTVETLHVNVTYGKTNNTPGKYDLKIYDISGSVVMQKTSDNTTWTENVSKFNPGVYIVELRNNDGSSLGKAKFVKK